MRTLSGTDASIISWFLGTNRSNKDLERARDAMKSPAGKQVLDEVWRLQKRVQRLERRLAPINCRRKCCSEDLGGCAGCGCHK